MVLRVDCRLVRLRHGAEVQREPSGGQGESVTVVKAVRRMAEAGVLINCGWGQTCAGGSG